MTSISPHLSPSDQLMFAINLSQSIVKVKQKIRNKDLHLFIIYYL